MATIIAIDLIKETLLQAMLVVSAVVDLLHHTKYRYLESISNIVQIVMEHINKVSQTFSTRNLFGIKFLLQIPKILLFKLMSGIGQSLDLKTEMK